MKSNFADNLKKLRKENNLSQEQLADKLGVSRQSVSKWESLAAYPEMDKVLQLCNMFNLNIDELLNQNISEIKEEEESKNRVNKYIDDFLEYIKKSVKMFFSMTFFEKCKCIFEQLIIILILFIISIILGGILTSAITSLLNLLPNIVNTIIYGILKGIYIFIYLVFTIIIVIYIFKIRYLDYYEFATSEELNNIEIKNEEKNTNNKKYIEKKIIIRDQEHPEYKFVNILLKGLLLMVKFFALIIFITSAVTFICLMIGLMISLYHITIHKIFIGITSTIVSLLVINTIFLILFYTFIFDKKIPIKKLFITFMISLVICGLGIGQIFICSLNFKYDNKEYINNKQLVKEIPYNDKLDIISWDGNYTYEVDNNLIDKVKITIKYNKKTSNVKIYESSENEISIDYTTEINSFKKVYKELIKELKNNTLTTIDINSPEIIITTNESNIKNIINNKTKNKMSYLEIKDNKYFLTLDEENYDDENEHILCYQKDGYYNQCVIVNLDFGNIDDFSFDQDILNYDKNKYTCEKNNDYYECEKIEN